MTGLWGLIQQFGAGALVAAILVLGTMGVRWITGMPDRTRAGNEREQLKINEAELIRTDYAAQIQEFRVEVHSYRNELAKLQIALSKTQNLSLRRGDRLNMVFFILRLVMGELRRLDPNSDVLAQAEALLSRVEHDSDADTQTDADAKDELHKMGRKPK